MTCIVGLESGPGKVFIGADSASVGGWTVRETSIPKVFRCNSFIIGYTSSFRMGQILQYHLDVRPQKPDEIDDAYMVLVFIEAVRKCLKDQGFAKIDNNVEEGGEFLVGYRGKLYRVDNDFQLNRAADGFNAVGCGADFALGAMKALEELPPGDRIVQSLEVAAHFSGAVLPPFTILSTEVREDDTDEPTG